MLKHVIMKLKMLALSSRRNKHITAWLTQATSSSERNLVYE